MFHSPFFVSAPNLNPFDAKSFYLCSGISCNLVVVPIVVPIVAPVVYAVFAYFSGESGSCAITA